MSTSCKTPATTAPEPEAEWIRLSGEIDIARTPELEETVRRLSTAPCRRVHVDLADVTFAGATLLTFLVRAYAATSMQAVLFVHHPTPMIHKIITIAGLDTIAILPTDHPR